jgi:hypothetical protein
MSLFVAGVFVIGTLIITIAVLLMRKFLKYIEKEDRDIQNLNS